MQPAKHRKKGSALITALFIMALIAAAATAMIYEMQISISNAEQTFNYSQALQYNATVADWALDTLQNAVKNSHTTPADKIPNLYPPTKVNGGQYRGVLYDMQAKFNLNNLADPKYRDGFTHLLSVILPTDKDPKLLSDAISNWVSPPGQFPLTFDDAYKKAGLPYTAAHRFMLNISELRKVAGVTAPFYRLLTQYVTVLPKKDTKLNINTAVIADLLTLNKNISLQTANVLASARPFGSDAEIAKNSIILNHKIQTSLLTPISYFFVARSLVQLGTQTLLTNNYITRNQTNGKTSILWQTQG